MAAAFRPPGLFSGLSAVRSCSIPAVSWALEEFKAAGLIPGYGVEVVDIRTGAQFKPEYVAINPNSKIPSVTVSKGEGKGHTTVWESGAILQFLCDKFDTEQVPAASQGSRGALRGPDVADLPGGGPGPEHGPGGPLLQVR